MLLANENNYVCMHCIEKDRERERELIAGKSQSSHESNKTNFKQRKKFLPHIHSDALTYVKSYCMRSKFESGMCRRKLVLQHTV